MPRYVAIKDTNEAQKFIDLGMKPFPSVGAPPGLEVAIAVLSEMGVSEDNIQQWVDEEHANAIEALSPVAMPDMDDMAEEETAKAA